MYQKPLPCLCSDVKGLCFTEFTYACAYLDCSGGLRLKRDITEYGEFVRSFNAPSVDENFELLGM